jgi:3'-phosphoadenosine 5'-phosphosulfate sulfotransferase (PAPS reductase)/FAD synthetase
MSTSLTTVRRGKYAPVHIPLPEMVRGGVRHKVSVSGGKDSLATYLTALHAGFPFEAVFADTGNEHEWTYDYIRRIPELTGGPEVRWVRRSFTREIEGKRKYVAEKWPEKGVSASIVERALVALQPTGNPFLDLCLWKGRFPSRKAQFCTQELKGQPISFQVNQPEYDLGHVVISWQGTRWDESLSRADLAIFQQLNDVFDPLHRDYWVYRPIAALSRTEVFALADQLGVPRNPLYLQGFSRVGCMPCVNCSKDELGLADNRFPDHIERIEEWEHCVGEASKRGVTTFFNIANDPVMGAEFRYSRALDGSDPHWRPATHGIRQMVQWSRTDHGGRQFNLFAKSPVDEACSLAGACE